MSELMLEILDDSRGTAVATSLDSLSVEITIQQDASGATVSVQEFIEITELGPAGFGGENLPFTHSGVLEVGVGAIGYPIKGGTFTILTIAARLASAPTGSPAILDVNKNGITIFGTQASRPTFAVTEKDATVGTPTISEVADGDVLTIDIDQIGSTFPGSYLTVVIRLQRIA